MCETGVTARTCLLAQEGSKGSGLGGYTYGLRGRNVLVLAFGPETSRRGNGRSGFLVAENPSNEFGETRQSGRYGHRARSRSFLETGLSWQGPRLISRHRQRRVEQD